MGKKRKHLSHEEIWDDSALVDSWDAALHEYQLYHSIHARGERVEDVLKSMELPEESASKEAQHPTPAPVKTTNGLPDTEDLEDGEVEDDEGLEDVAATVGTIPDPAQNSEEIPQHQHDPLIKASNENTNYSAGSHGMPEALMDGGSYTVCRRSRDRKGEELNARSSPSGTHHSVVREISGSGADSDIMMEGNDLGSDGEGGGDGGDIEGDGDED